MADKGSSSLKRRQTLLRLGNGLLATLCVMCIYIWQPDINRQMDRHLYDLFLRQHAGGTPSPTPAVIDLDEASLHKFGQWPWPRHLVARLLKTLTENGAVAIGLDILLAEPDRTSPVSLQEALHEGFGVDVRFEGLPDALKDNDVLLADVLSQTPSVLGIYTQFVAGKAPPFPEDVPRWEGILERTPAGGLAPRSNILKGEGATLPLRTLLHAAPLGSINVAPDPDGIIRSVPLLTDVNGRIVIALGLRSLMRGLGVKNLILEGGPDGLRAVRVGKYTVPVTPGGFLQVAFRGPRGVYPYFSALDVLEGRVGPEELEGRVLLLGTSAPGLLDIRATPFDSVYPGVETHAAVVDAILTGRHIETPPWIPGAQILSIGLLGLMGTLAFSLAPAVVYLPLFLLLGGGSLWGTWQIFQNGIFISPQYMLMTLVASAVMLLAVRFWQETRHKRLLRQAFSRYVAPDMVERIAERGEAVMAGEEREVTLMFTDIRGFTSLSEKLAPAQVVAVLNRYFTPMTSLIRGSGGTVDKFIGDAIMAFWNAPLDVSRHELRAVFGALDMQEALTRLNTELLTEFDISLRMGVGVHTGKVYVGNMGSAELLDYTCIGDTVNLTSRLEGLCPAYGVSVVVSAATAERCLAVPDSPRPLPAFIPLDAIRVKGKTEPVEIRTPVAAEEAMQRKDELDAFAQAREAYVAGHFAEAAAAFASLRERFPDTLLYQIYGERSETLMAAPPEHWDGVWTFTKK